MVDLSIIIVCYKGWDRLIKCLESLNTFTGKSFATEVIVVDNKSGENTINEIEKQFPGFRFIHNTINGGFSFGCNTGAKVASGEMLLFLNPDTVALETEVEKLLIAAKQNPSYSVLSCRQVNENGKESIASGQFPYFFNLTGLMRTVFGRRKTEDRSRKEEQSLYGPHASNLTPLIIFPDWVSGSVIMIRKEVFDKIEGFDEDYWMYFEDVDLCRRVRNIAGEIALFREITIEHNHGGSSRINLKTTSLTKAEVYISRHLYISKHKSGFDKYFIQTFLVINNLISGSLMGLLGLVLFFVPKVFVRTMIFFRMIVYYGVSAIRLSWISHRSVNY